MTPMTPKLKLCVGERKDERMEMEKHWGGAEIDRGREEGGRTTNHADETDDTRLPTATETRPSGGEQVREEKPDQSTFQTPTFKGSRTHKSEPGGKFEESGLIPAGVRLLRAGRSEFVSFVPPAKPKGRLLPGQEQLYRLQAGRRW